MQPFVSHTQRNSVASALYRNGGAVILAFVQQPVEYLGARGPERDYDFDSDGQRLHLHEWGDPSAIPILLCHGMWDHARGFDLLAPYLAEDYRVIAVDARGHGDSAWVDNYLWTHDVTDIIRVLKRVGRAHVVGHSRGGMLATYAAAFAPEHTRRLINIEGFGPGSAAEPVPGQVGMPTPGSTESLRQYLDGRRRAHAYADWRPYETLDELVVRRRRTSPRLSDDWLRYFCWHGSRRAADGFRWKVDPMAGAGAGPYKPEWIVNVWSRVHRPMLAVIAEQPDTWGPVSDDVLDERLGCVPNLTRARVPKTGHFPHMEEPKATAKLILDYLAA